MFIKDENQYNKYLAEVERLAIHDPEEGTEEAERLSLLALALEEFEKAKYTFDLPSPIEAIKFRMEEQGLQQTDLVPIIGSKSKVSEVLSGKRPLSLTMIRALHKYLEISPKILLQDSDREKNVFDFENINLRNFPLKELTSRGWIKATAEQISSDSRGVILGFLKPLKNFVPANAMWRRSEGTGDEKAKLSLYSWAAYVIRKSEKIRPISQFDPALINKEFLRDVAKLSYFDNGPSLAIELLSKHGIILIFEKHLPKTKLDGGVFFNKSGYPVIGMTLRHDRIDYFWFTLLHELAHIFKHLKSDTEIFVDDLESEEFSDPKEREADKIARDSFIPKNIWRRSDALILRDEVSVKQLAEECRIHPAIVAGRIRRETNNYTILSELLGIGSVRKTLVAK